MEKPAFPPLPVWKDGRIRRNSAASSGEDLRRYKLEDYDAARHDTTRQQGDAKLSHIPGDAGKQYRLFHARRQVKTISSAHRGRQVVF